MADARHARVSNRPQQFWLTSLVYMSITVELLDS